MVSNTLNIHTDISLNVISILRVQVIEATIFEFCVINTIPCVRSSAIFSIEPIMWHNPLRYNQKYDLNIEKQLEEIYQKQYWNKLGN